MFAINMTIFLIGLPIIVAQYGLALFCLTRLAYVQMSKKSYVIWNLFILLIFFIGDIVFLIYYYGYKKKQSNFVPSAVIDTKTEETKSEQLPQIEKIDSDK